MSWQDEELVAVDGHLGAAVLRVEDGVTDLDVEGDDVAGRLGPLAGADSEDGPLLRLLLGGVGDDDAAGGLLFRGGGLDHDAVGQGLDVDGHDMLGCDVFALGALPRTNPVPVLPTPEIPANSVR